MMSAIGDSVSRSAPAESAGPAAAPLPSERRFSLRWYALRVRHRHEFATRDELRRTDIEVFLPTCEVESAWSDRTQIVTKPLFPGYLFARFAAANKAQVFVRGVLEILSLDNSPVSVPDGVIEALQRAVVSRGAVSHHPYVVGRTVTVSRGPFAGCTGVVTRTQGSTLLSIPVEILGRSVSVTISADDVAPENAT